MVKRAVLLPALLLAPGVAWGQAGPQKVALGPGDVPASAFSESLDLSDDGRYAVFVSFDADLAPGEANNKEDAFVRDLLLGVTERVAPGADERVSNPAISGDGRYVVFTSPSTTLVGTPVNESDQVFVFDRLTGTTTLMSESLSSEGGDGDSDGASISNDGQWVTFYSYAPDLIPGDNNMVADVFLRDTQSGFTERINLGPNGEICEQHSYTSAQTPDLRYVFFETRSNDIEAQPNNYRDIWRRDRVLQTTEKVSLDWQGGASDGRSEGPIDVSDDGRFVAFTSEADDLVAGQHDDPFPVRAVFVRDMLLGTTELISVDPLQPGQPELGDCYGPSMTADGRYVVFSCADSGIVYLRDRELGSLFRLDVSALGAPGNGFGSEAVISDDGTLVGFTSQSTNLVAGDDNLSRDAFVRSWERTGALQLDSLVAGTTATATVSGLAPSTFVLLGVSFQGAGPTPYALLGLTGLADLASLDLFFTGTTDATGTYQLSATLGPGTSGLPVAVQALDLFTGAQTPAFNGLVQ